MESLSTSEPPRVETDMPVTGLVAALAAAGAGTLVWAAVSYFTGYEVGYVAWALGGLVGFAMARFGGRGTTSAITAAVLTVLGIAGGKLLGTRFVVEKELRDGCEATFTRELHQELAVDAADLAQLGDDASANDLRQFMVEHRYTGASAAEEVQDDELETFVATQVPELRAMQATRPSYEVWFAERTAESRREFERGFSIVQANIEELNPIDLLFVVLGVTTAFGIVRRASAPADSSGDQGAPPADGQQYRKAA